MNIHISMEYMLSLFEVKLYQLILLEKCTWIGLSMVYKIPFIWYINTSLYNHSIVVFIAFIYPTQYKYSLVLLQY